MSQAEIDSIKREIQAIKDVLNYRGAVEDALEKGLPAPPALNLDGNFLMYKKMSPQDLQRQLEQLQEEKNLLLRALPPPSTGPHADENIVEALHSLQHTHNALLALMVGVSAPVPESTASQRNENQEAFKVALKARYPHCVAVNNTTNPPTPLLKCMILDHSFSPNMVTAGHIIGLTNHQSFPIVGLNYSTHRYHERNGLLIFTDIDRKYGNQLITFIYNETDHLFRLQVLYDDVLNLRVGNLTKRVINALPANNPLTYRDINGRPLILPDLTRQPFRRALVYMAKTACVNALGSPRPHNCLLQLDMTEQRWEAILASVRSESIDFGYSPFGTLQNMLAEV